MPESSRDVGVKVVSNALWIYADQLIRVLIGLFTFGAVARYLGPEGYGVLAFATTFPAVFMPLARMGLEYIVVQELVRRPSEQGRIMGTAVNLMIGGVAVSLLVAFLCIGLVDKSNPARDLIWVTNLLLVAQPLLIFDFFFQSKISAKHTVLVRLGASVLINGCRLVLVFGEAPLMWFAWLIVVEAVISGAGLWIVGRRGDAPKFGDADWAEAKLQMSAAWPLLLAGIAMTGYLKLDQLLLSRLAGVRELGLYAAAFRFADIGQLVTYAMITSYFPRFIALHAQGDDRSMDALRDFWRRITWLAILVALGASVATPLLLARLLGAGFAEASLPLIILTWGNVFAAQIGVRGKWFLAEGMQMQSLYFFIGGALLHLVGVYFVGGALGATGAAVSYLAAQIAMTLVFPLFLNKTRSAVRASLRSFNLFTHAT